MSSNADFDAAMNTNKADTLFDELMTDFRSTRDEKPKYATFDIEDEPASLSRVIAFMRRNWVKIVGYGSFLIMVIIMIITVERSDTDSSVWPWQASISGLVNQPAPIDWSPVDDHMPQEPMPLPMQEQTPTVPSHAPSMEQQTPTQNNTFSVEIVVPFGLLPRLIEIDPPTQKGDGAHEHMNHLEPQSAW